MPGPAFAQVKLANQQQQQRGSGINPCRRRANLIVQFIDRQLGHVIILDWRYDKTTRLFLLTR
jgi:hypothetical protein